MKKIDDAIEREHMKTGKMGTEEVTVKVLMTEEQFEEFKADEAYDNEHYSYEYDQKIGELRISHVEEI